MDKTFKRLALAEDWLISKGYEQTSYDKYRWRNPETGHSVSVFFEGGFPVISMPELDEEEDVQELNFED